MASCVELVQTPLTHSQSQPNIPIKAMIQQTVKITSTHLTSKQCRISVDAVNVHTTLFYCFVSTGVVYLLLDMDPLKRY